MGKKGSPTPDDKLRDEFQGMSDRDIARRIMTADRRTAGIARDVMRERHGSDRRVEREVEALAVNAGAEPSNPVRRAIWNRLGW
jgi:hypothetical protein